MKVGIVGTNFVSDMFIEAQRDIPELEIASVCSGHYENALAFQKKHDIETAYESFDDMLNDHKMDVIYLAVPNSLHQAMAMDCASMCTPVIVEKPFAPTLRQAQMMYRYANTMNTYIHDAIVPLYTDNFARLKASLPKVGKIRKAVITLSKYSSRYDAYLNGENPTTFRKELCNGCWMDLGVYVVAVAVGLFGKPNRIQSSAVLLESGVDGSGSAILSYDGFDVVLLASKHTDTKIISEIEGEDGILQFEQTSLVKNITFYDRKEKTSEILSVDNPNPFRDQLVDFVDSMNNHKKESSKVSHALSMDIVEVLETCRKQSGVLFKGEVL